MQKKRAAVISGGGQGLGLAIALEFLQNDFDVTICGRNTTTLTKAKDFLQEQIALKNREVGHNQDLSRVHVVTADIAQPEAVSRLLLQVLESHQKIDVLINNAAILGPIGNFDTVDWSLWVETVQVNLFGTMLMSRAFMPHFKQNKSGKIINISGGGATASRPNFSAYAASKTAVVRMTEIMADEVKEFGIAINAIAPGILNTAMNNKMLQAGPDAIGAGEYAKLEEQKTGSNETLLKASQLCLFLANQKDNGITGKLLSAVWDDWANLSSHKQELEDSDVYTLRRIVPSDRDFYWSDG